MANNFQSKLMFTYMYLWCFQLCIKVAGTGASGSFRLGEKLMAPIKANTPQKPAAKKAVAAKMAAKTHKAKTHKKATKKAAKKPTKK